MSGPTDLVLLPKVCPKSDEGTSTVVLTTTNDAIIDINFSDTKNIGFVVDQLNEFREKRNTKKNNKFLNVWIFGMTLLVVGMVLYEIFNYCVQVTVNVVYQAIFAVLTCLFMTVTVSGVVICSTVDPSKVDYDSVVESGGSSSIFFRIVTTIILIVDALSWYGVCAIPAILLAVYNLIFIVPFKFLNIKYTSRFIFSMVLDELVTSISFMYNAYESANDGNYSGRYVLGIVANEGFPYGSVFLETWIVLAVLSFLEFCILLSFWIYQRYLAYKQSKKAMNPTTIMYISFYMFLNRYGLLLLMRGSVCIYYQDHPNHKGSFVSSSSYIYNIVLVVTGILSLLPPIGLISLGPSNVFNFTARAFDRNLENLKQDGKFIAELLEGVEISIGDKWWIHYDKVNNVQRLEFTDTGDHRKNWYQGVISNIDDTQMSVTISDMDKVIILPRKSAKKNMQVESVNRVTLVSREDDMLIYASKNLRCIDWDSMTEELFTKSVRDNSTTSLYSLSRPLREKEAISYFISHAWDDDGKLKYQKLKLVAESHRSSHGEYPTFWFDKVCFDQDNIADGLKVLPINVMSCQKLLVLYGKHYASRLWCIWELFVMFSFAELSQAQKRLTICPLEIGMNLSLSLEKFDSCNAHCYDPNEEAKLRQVITAAGYQGEESEFNFKIRKLSQYLNDSSGSAKGSGASL